MISPYKLPCKRRFNSIGHTCTWTSIMWTSILSCLVQRRLAICALASFGKKWYRLSNAGTLGCCTPMVETVNQWPSDEWMIGTNSSGWMKKFIVWPSVMSCRPGRWGNCFLNSCCATLRTVSVSHPVVLCKISLSLCCKLRLAIHISGSLISFFNL